MSLPTRERELKHQLRADGGVVSASLPTRERELKRRRGRARTARARSLPTRERELKPDLPVKDALALGRSLHGSVN